MWGVAPLQDSATTVRRAASRKAAWEAMAKVENVNYGARMEGHSQDWAPSLKI